MVALLLLGLVPGTSIQIDFNHWLMFMSLLMAVLTVNACHKKHLDLYLLVLLSIRVSTYRAKPLRLA